MSTLAFFHWDVDPVIFHIGPFPLRYYSLFFVFGLSVAYIVLQKKYVGKTMTHAQLDRLAVYIFLGTLIGARLGHCLFYEPSYFLEHPSEIFLPFHISDDGSFHYTGYQGLASHGGAIGILLGLFLYSRQQKIPFLSVADQVVLVVPLAAASIRIGNFFNSEIVGNATNLPWAVIFSRVDNIPRHPTQLYEAICYSVIFVFLYQKFGHEPIRKIPNGKILGWFLLLIFTTRFFIEFIKTPQENFEKNMNLNLGQLFSIPFILFAIVLVFFRNKNSSSTNRLY